MIHAFSILPIWVMAVRERYVAALGLGSMQIGPSVVGAAVAVVANLVLLPTVGVIGAAWATVISYSAALGWSAATRAQRRTFAPLFTVDRS